MLKSNFLQGFFKKTKNRDEIFYGYLFILPSLIGFILFFAIPGIRAISISFTEWNLITEAKYVGLENYDRLLNDEDFWHSLWVTFTYFLVNIPVQMSLALLIAVFLDRFNRSSWMRSVVILPWLLPNVVVALLWLWMLDPTLGVINGFLKSFGIPQQPFFGSVDQAIPTIALVNVWRYVGYSAILLYSGLKIIPSSVYEAAQIDGASEYRIFRSITIPLLRPVLAFVFITTVIGSFQIFDTIAVTTEGGPVDATRVIVWYIFEFAFQRFDMGYATTIAVALFIILIGVTTLQWRFWQADRADVASA